MVFVRIGVISACLGAVCTAAAYWTVFAVERLTPLPEPIVFASLPSPERPVVETPFRGGPLPSASDVRSVQGLLARLRAAHGRGGADWAELCALSDAAVRFGAAAVSPLSGVALGDGEPLGLRLLAVEMLGRIEDPAVVGVLMEALHERQPEDLRLSALTAIGANPVARARSATLLAGLLRDDARPAIRGRAAELAGRHAGPVATEPLLRALRLDPSPEVRISAASALGGRMDFGTVPAFRDAVLLDPDPAVRVAALEAVGSLRNPGLREFFRAVEAGDGDYQVQSAARRQLWRIPAGE